MSRRSDELREEAKLRALRLISVEPTITQRALAEELGISLGATHNMLRELAERGLVKLASLSAARDKRGYTYVLTPMGLAEKKLITAHFLVRKRAEFDALRNEIDELSAELRLDGAGRERDGSSGLRAVDVRTHPHRPQR